MTREKTGSWWTQTLSDDVSKENWNIHTVIGRKVKDESCRITQNTGIFVFGNGSHLKGLCLLLYIHFF